MNQSEFDVVIVGASIAGCAAATFFARRGASVALVERHEDPGAYKKICTHYIQASAVPAMRRLGIVPLIEEQGAVRNGINSFTRWGWIVEDDPEGAGRLYGYNFSREKLDPLVRRMAVGTPGVTYYGGWSAKDLIRSGGRVAGVLVERAGEPLGLRARLVVGADGRNSRIAALLNGKAKVRPNNRFAYFAYFRGLRLTSGSISQMWFLEPDMAYAFPNEDGVTVLAVMPAKDKLEAFKQDVEGNFYRCIESLPDGPNVREAERVSEILGMLDMPNISRPPVQEGAALIGDAAMASDPLFGVGCGWAFETAEWLVNSTAEAVLGKGDLDQALKRYAKKHRSKLAGHHFVISDFSTGRPYNPIERLMFSAAVKDAKTREHFTKFGARASGVLEFMSPLALARAAFVNLRDRRPVVKPQGFRLLEAPARAEEASPA